MVQTVRLIIFLFIGLPLCGEVDLGVDTFFRKGHDKSYRNKRIGLVSNQTGVDKRLTPTLDVLRKNGMKVVALFSPEHGWHGSSYAFEKVKDGAIENLPIYSLHGKTRRPTDQMLKGIDLLIYDIQDVGTRSYTYATTLFYVMEEAVKQKIPVLVFDRPNPINGLIIDGGMLEEKWRSFIGYINVPYCHGMTIGELAAFFNGEYKIGCDLKVIPMKGWKRSMSFKETGLTWIPTSPHIPESDTPLFYASTGIIGELGILNIGIGYTLPFKVVGAPWIDANVFAAKLNSQKLPGVHFFPFNYRPFYGSMKDKDCHGVLIRVTDIRCYKPTSVQYLLMGILKSLYPKETKGYLQKVEGSKKRLFNLANGNDEIYRIMLNERYAAWKMIAYQQDERERFKKVREKYLLY
ncbi:MAG: DUF1343 domain-containing protein [Simkaniaceae bacterium]|nr:DUF1343 domain-containing protein [Simkaniaceae bacterium]